MWILRFKSSNIHGGKQLSSLQSLIHTHFSTQSSQNHQISERHFMVDFLVNSVGFSEDQALSALTKIGHLKSTEKPNSVVDFFKKCGFDKTQVRNIVCYCPKILATKVDKTLAPKIRVLQELGLPIRDFVKLLKQSSNISCDRIGVNVDYLREVLNSDEEVVKVIKKSWWLFSANYAKKMSPNFLILKKIGLSDDKIKKLLLENPVCLMQDPEQLKAAIKKVEPVLGIPLESPRFIYGLLMVLSLRESTIDMKYGIFRSFGWSDSEILTMTRSSPYCLKRSEDGLKVYLRFFMSELGYTAAYLATHQRLFFYNLEKRVKPRHKVLEILKEKKLLKNKFSLCSVAGLTEGNFIKDFVMPYHESVPHLYESYTSASGYLQKKK